MRPLPGSPPRPVVSPAPSSAQGVEGELAAFRRVLAQALGITDRQAALLLTPAVRESVTPQGEHPSWLRLDQRLTTVERDSLAPRQVEALAGAVSGLATSVRAAVVAALEGYVQAGARGSRPSAVRAGQQILEALAERSPSPRLEGAAHAAQAKQRLIQGDFAGALAQLDAAGRLPAPPELRLDQVLDRAQALALAANTAERGQRLPSAVELTRLREAQEAAGAPAELVARLSVLEVDGYLAANESRLAERALAQLHALAKAHPGLKWLQQAVASEDGKRGGGAEAFLKVALAELATQTMQETVLVGLGGAAAGALAGAAAGSASGAGAVAGAAAGALTGAAAGTAGLKIRNALRGWRSAVEAGQTGLAGQDGWATALNASVLALEAATVAAPLRGAAVLRGGAFPALTGLGTPAARAEGEAVLAGLTARVERAALQSLGPRAQAQLGQAELTRLAKELLVRAAAEETLRFGGKPLAAGALALVVGPFAAELTRIQCSDAPEAQKAEERRRLSSQLGHAVVSFALLSAPFVAVSRFTLTGSAPAPMRAALAAEVPRRAALQVVSPEAFDGFVQAREGEVEALPAAQQAAARARLAAIRERGTGLTDPVTGRALVSRAALQRPDAARLVAHEAAHLRFHALPARELDGLVSAVSRHPSFPGLLEELHAAQPHARAFSGAQAVDELLAELAASPGPSRLATLAEPVLKLPEVKAAGFGAPARALDLARLLKKGELTVGKRPYLARSGETLPVGDSEPLPYVAPESLWPLRDALSQGQRLPASREQLIALQASALRSAEQLFDNSFGSDTALRSAVERKLSSYAFAQQDRAYDEAVFGGRDPLTQQRDALKILIGTFQNDSATDALLRQAASAKLAELGEAEDVYALLPLVRRGDGADLYTGVIQIEALTARTGTPQRRWRMSEDSELGPLLAQDSVTPEEAARIIDSVIERGEIDWSKTRRFEGNNSNDVYFLTFKDTLPAGNGERLPIEGVWKPEETWFGKGRAFFTREVAAYRMDRDFTRTGHVPPTYEVVLQMGDAGAQVGSLQWRVPNARPLGRTATELDPELAGFVQSEGYLRQEAKIRTLAYLMGDVDKLPNNVTPTPNYENLLVDADGKVWMIDNAYSLGAPEQEIDTSILPEQLPPDLAATLRDVPPERWEYFLRGHVRDVDAASSRQRLQTLQQRA